MSNPRTEADGKYGTRWFDGGDRIEINGKFEMIPAEMLLKKLGLEVPTEQHHLFEAGGVIRATTAKWWTEATEVDTHIVFELPHGMAAIRVHPCFGPDLGLWIGPSKKINRLKHIDDTICKLLNELDEILAS